MTTMADDTRIIWSIVAAPGQVVGRDFNLIIPCVDMWLKSALQWWRIFTERTLVGLRYQLLVICLKVLLKERHLFFILFKQPDGYIGSVYTLLPSFTFRIIVIITFFCFQISLSTLLFYFSQRTFEYHNLKHVLKHYQLPELDLISCSAASNKLWS